MTTPPLIDIPLNHSSIQTILNEWGQENNVPFIIAVKGASLDEDDQLTESEQAYSASFPTEFEEIEPPVLEDFEFAATGAGSVIIDQTQWEYLIQHLRDNSILADGEQFREFGAIGFGVRGKRGEELFYLPITHIPLPQDVTSNSGNLNFQPRDWAAILSAADELEARVGRTLKIVDWVHTHPGTAFLSKQDTDIQEGQYPSASAVAIVVGRGLLEEQDQSMVQLKAAREEQQLATAITGRHGQITNQTPIQFASRANLLSAVGIVNTEGVPCLHLPATEEAETDKPTVIIELDETTDIFALGKSTDDKIVITIIPNEVAGTSILTIRTQSGSINIKDLPNEELKRTIEFIKKHF